MFNELIFLKMKKFSIINMLSALNEAKLGNMSTDGMLALIKDTTAFSKVANDYNAFMESTRSKFEKSKDQEKAQKDFNDVLTKYLNEDADVEVTKLTAEDFAELCKANSFSINNATLLFTALVG